MKKSDLKKRLPLGNSPKVKLDEMAKFNMDLLKEVKLEKVRSKLKSLVLISTITLILFVLAASYSMYFTVTHWGTWYFVFSGVVVTFASVLYIIASIKQLVQILSIDYADPISKLHESISEIKPSIIYNLRIAVWGLPFAPFLGVFLSKAIFQYDLTQFVSINMIASFGIVTIVLEIIALFLAKSLKSKNTNKKWVNWLIIGSGSQIDEALSILDQIKEEEIKMTNDPS